MHNIDFAKTRSQPRANTVLRFAFLSLLFMSCGGEDSSAPALSRHTATDSPTQYVPQPFGTVISYDHCKGCTETSSSEAPHPVEEEGVRVLRIRTLSGPSWVAWSEIEVLATYSEEGGAPVNIAADALVTSSAPAQSDDLGHLVDGDPDTVWNAGDFPPVWVDLEFPMPIDLAQLRMNITQNPAGLTHHEILAGPNADNLSVLHRFEQYTSGGSALVYPHPAASDDDVSLVFNILIRQTHQSCSGCGIWFDWHGVQNHKPRLEIEFEHDGALHNVQYQHGRMGMDNAHAIWLQSGQGHDATRQHQMQSKQGPHRNALFRVDASDIPIDARIVDARLHLHLNSHEGLANGDRSSVLKVHACTKDWDWDSVSWTHATTDQPWDTPGGDYGAEIREIHAGRDMHERGFNKANPNGFFDFTQYFQQLQLARSAATASLHDQMP